MTSIFHNQKKITLIADIDLINTDFENCSVYQIDDIIEFDFFNVMQNEEFNTVYFVFENEVQLLNSIKKQFDLIIAAGGIVNNSKNEILLIHRLGKWDLPKGKVEKNEQLEEAALREVTEETGITHLQIIDFCCNTYHTYLQNNMWILKETAWFFMKTTNNIQELIPQTIEGITAVNWVKKNNLNEYSKNTYENIQHVLQQAILQG
jgi:ADP-ribose pyrophosphatase YjhB (NUDIX family)